MKGIAYLLQASLISLWWVGLIVNEAFYEAFQFPDISATAFNSFLIPDIIVIGIFSIIIAYRKLDYLQYVVLGAFGYAALFCINATILSGGGYLSSSIMFLGLCYNLFLVYQSTFFKVSTNDSFLINLLKTILQVICIWSITLLVIPVIILTSFKQEIVLEIESNILSAGLFVLFSLLNLYAGYTMVLNGKGTPLPFDQTQNLVVVGPYRYVRNPMATAGVGQVIALGMIFNSLAIVVYAFIGAILWHYVVRPSEELDMENRFGESYNAYRKKVRCWIPTFKKSN
ncbi:MAG: isoprenylcysteine carboxylmethyltransferase family protein [Crocinitomicaceae bacterium]